MSLQRWDHVDGRLVSDVTGEWVRYADAAAVLARIRGQLEWVRYFSRPDSDVDREVAAALLMIRGVLEKKDRPPPASYSDATRQVVDAARALDTMGFAMVGGTEYGDWNRAVGKLKDGLAAMSKESLMEPVSVPSVAITTRNGVVLHISLGAGAEQRLREALERVAQEEPV